MSYSIYNYTTTTGTSTGPISISFSSPAPVAGNNIRICPGKGDPGMPDGKVIFESADGEELLSFNSDKTVSILGVNFSLELIRDALKDFKSENCKCALNILLNQGCKCGGS